LQKYCNLRIADIYQIWIWRFISDKVWRYTSGMAIGRSILSSQRVAGYIGECISRKDHIDKISQFTV